MPPMQVEDVWEQVLITLKNSFVIVDPTLELAITNLHVSHSRCMIFMLISYRSVSSYMYVYLHEVPQQVSEHVSHARELARSITYYCL